MIAGRVIRRKRDTEGKPIRHDHANPILDIRVYEVGFVNGGHAEDAANVIAENMYAQCDVEGNQFQIMDYCWPQGR